MFNENGNALYFTIECINTFVRIKVYGPEPAGKDHVFIATKLLNELKRGEAFLSRLCSGLGLVFLLGGVVIVSCFIERYE